MTIGRDLVQQAFPGQPRMQAAFESLVSDAEDATDRLKQAITAIGTLAGGAEGIVAQLAQKQPKNDTLSALAQLSTDPGVIEQIQPGIISIRQVDSADTKSLLTRNEADSRYLGGAHGAASAAKWTTARTITITGDASWSASIDGSANVSSGLTIANDAVTYAKMQNVSATSRFIGRITAGAGDAEELTGTQATTLLDTFTSALKGLAPASGGGTTNFLRADGTWASPGSGVTPAALTKTDDTNVTLTLGGTPATALLQAASITVGWTGQLAVGRGGTGIASYAVGDILYASASTTLSKLADVATGNVLISGGVTTAPSWGKVGLTTHVTGTLGTGNGGTGSTSASLGTGGVALSTEGTFTPTLIFGAGSTGMTFSRQDGRWKKVGNVIHVWMDLILTAKGSSTGNAQISNLPVAALAAAHVSAMLTPANMSAGTNNPRPLLVAGTTQLFIYDFNAGALNVMTDANFTNTTELIIYVAYPLT